jgi:tetratricopeptide (TPR) repeat protein
VEALAEYTSTYITDRERVLDSDFEKKFANRLLVPAPRDLDAALHFKLGYSAFNHQQFDEAIAEYSKCTAIDPTAAMPHVRLAVSLAKKAQYEKAMSECKSAEACFEKARIPFEDSEFNYLLESKSTIAYRRGDYAQSIAAMNKVLEYQPPSRDKFYQRVWAEEKLTQYAPAALDLYEWHCANAVNDYIHSGMSDWRSTMNLLDAEVTRFPGLGNPLARRARFLETRGDAANNSDKMDFYARALSDVLGTIGKPDRVQERAFLDCGRLCYKLGRVDQIQGYIDKMTDTDTDTTSDEKDVLRIVLADGQGDKEKAAELFRAFKDRILHGQKPKMEKPFDYVTSLPALLSLPSLPSLPLSHGYRSLNELFQFRPFINQPMELRD